MKSSPQPMQWFSLIDISGPFLAGRVIEDAFPQGLDKVDTPRRQRLRAAYDEWQDAVDEDDPQLSELHDAWIWMVISEALEYEEQVLVTREQLGDNVVHCVPEHGVEERPDFAVRTDDGAYRLLISTYPPGTDLEKPGKHDRWPVSPAERMTSLCRACEVRLGLITNGEQWMLVNAPIGSTSSYVSWFARIWWQEPITLKAFVSLLGVRRCFGPDKGQLNQLLERSLEFQEEVTDTLGEQVRRAVEVLVQALGRADQDRNGELLKDVSPETLYEAGLTVMMRLVFILCAEERDLLLLGNQYYDQHYAISSLRASLREDEDLHGAEVLERRKDAWSRILTVFRMVYCGVEHESLWMPALGGSLFDPDKFPFLEGRPACSSWRDIPASPLPIDNRTVLLLMNALQVLEQRGGAQLLSYRALDVEQIGHVYEGLLEHTVKRLSEPTVALIGSKKVRRLTITLQDLKVIAAGPLDAGAKKLADLTGRTKTTIKRALESGGDDSHRIELTKACGGDEHLVEELLPFATLIQTDSWGTLLVYRENAFAIVPGTDRRETGTHYTPRSLTETIVEKTLEPVVYLGPSEGIPREEWKLKTPGELLDLKICDPAMGSGAFLVEACRYLSQRLVEAWQFEEEAGKVVTAKGEVVDQLEDRDPLSQNLTDRLVFARRMIADRCLYGVDKNRLAVELAKLSLWLVTLSKNRPFGFLDHALRSGDSLIGLSDIRQLERFALREEDDFQEALPLFQTATNIIKSVIQATKTQRLALERKPSNTVQDIEAKAKQFHNIQSQTIRLNYLADLIIAAYWEGGRPNQIQSRLKAMFHNHVDRFRDGSSQDQLATAKRIRDKVGCPKPFHWPIEFPEVFQRDNGGFDAIVGNPPFLGNRLWKSMIGDWMQWQAELILGQSPGKIDLCVVFHRRVVQLLRGNGGYGLLATTNIAEGTAIPLGLGQICKQGEIVFAIKVFKWPGKASVTAATVCFFKGEFNGFRFLDGKSEDYISPRLDAVQMSTWEPVPLPSHMLSLEGVHNGKGLAFVISAEDPWFNRLESEPNSLLRPYITGNDITSSALNTVKRWALDIEDRDLDDIRRMNPIAFQFLMEVVKPTRTQNALKSYKGLIDRWWQFWNHRADLMRQVRKRSHVIVFSKITKHPICMLADPSWVYTNKVVLVDIERNDLPTILLSTFFTEWLVAQQGAKFGVGASLTLAIREAFDTFPLPSNTVSDQGVTASRGFQDIIQRWCQTNACGLTELADTLGDSESHDPDIVKARELLTTIDDEVAKAYGMEELDLTRGFHRAPYIVNDSIAFLATPLIRSQIVGFLTELNRKQYQANHQ